METRVGDAVALAWGAFAAPTAKSKTKMKAADRIAFDFFSVYVSFPTHAVFC
jgi:hypothetical protein